MLCHLLHLVEMASFTILAIAFSLRHINPLYFGQLIRSEHETNILDDIYYCSLLLNRADFKS